MVKRVDEAAIERARTNLGRARDARSRLLNAHTLMWHRIKSSLSQPRKTPRAEILVPVGQLVTLLDAAQQLAETHVQALVASVDALEATRVAQDAARSHKQARGVAVQQYNQLSEKHAALLRRVEEQREM